jgi:two-component system chemotaxis response regulator CheY
MRETCREKNKMTPTILAVDDSTSVLKMVESALRYKGYAVVAAADGVEALEALEREQFNLVVLDINMPRMDGLSLLKTIRERPEWAGLPILMLTTEGQETDRDRALAMGATDYMVKPFKPTQLLERVAALLEASA